MSFLSGLGGLVGDIAGIAGNVSDAVQTVDDAINPPESASTSGVTYGPYAPSTGPSPLAIAGLALAAYLLLRK